MFYRDYEAAELEDAVKRAVEHHISTSEGVRHLLGSAHSSEATITPLGSWPSLPTPDVSELGAVQ